MNTNMWRRTAHGKLRECLVKRVYGSRTLAHVPYPKPNITVKEPIPIETQQEPTTKDRQEFFEKLQKLGRKELFYWKDFRFELPYSPFVDKNTSESFEGEEIFHNPMEGDRNQHIPSPNGNQKLSKQQLLQIRKTGTFTTLDTKNNEHTWRVTPLLASGEKTYKEMFTLSMKMAYRCFYNVPYYLKSEKETFSYHNAVKHLKKIPEELKALFIGVPEMRFTFYHATRLLELRNEFLFREFLPDIKEWQKKTKEWEHILKQRGNSFPDIKTRVNSLQFTRSVGDETVHLDLRFWDREIKKNVGNALTDLIRHEKAEWDKDSLLFVEKTLENYSLDNPEKFDEISNSIKRKARKECTERLLNRISECSEILEYEGGSGVVPLLRALVRSNFVLHEVELHIKQKHEESVTAIREKLIEKHPYRSTTTEWLNEEVEKQERKQLNISPSQTVSQYYRICKYKQAIASIEDLTQDPSVSSEEKEIFRQHVFLAKRALQWMESEKDQAIEALEKEKVPVKKLTYKFPIQKPEDRPIEKNQQNNTFEWKYHNTTMVATDHEGWRQDAFKEGVKELNALIKDTARESLFHGPLSYRALLPSRFSESATLDPKTGQVTYSKDQFPTMLSQLRSVWKSVKKSRSAFEKEKDAGFLGKGFSRICNVAWNYGIKGGLGSTLLLTLYPPLVIVSSAFSAALLAASPILAPIVVSIQQLCKWTILDWDLVGTNSTSSRYAPVFSIVGYRFAQFMIGATVSLGISLITPIFSLIALVVGSTYCSLGRTYDTIMYNVVIKPFGRVPQSNSFVVRRIEGPGLNLDHVYQIGAVEALTILQLTLEHEALSSYKEITERQLEIPANNLKEFIHEVLGPLGVASFRNPTIEISEKKHLRALQNIYDKRLSQLPKINKISNIMRKVRMNPVEFEVMMIRGEALVKDFVEKRIFEEQYLSSNQLMQYYWNNHDVSEVGDWKGLTMKKLSYIFSPEFLFPIHEEASSVHLEIQHSTQLDNFLKTTALDKSHNNLDRSLTTMDKLPSFPLDDTLHQSTFFPDGMSIPLLQEAFAPFPSFESSK